MNDLKELLSKGYKIVPEEEKDKMLKEVGLLPPENFNLYHKQITQDSYYVLGIKNTEPVRFIQKK